MFSHASIPESDVYYLLGNARRRATLTALWRRQAESGESWFALGGARSGRPVEAVTLRELSELIAAEEAGVAPAPRPLRQSVYNALHQTHLPKLHEFGLVEYDPDRKLVRPRPESRHLHRYMDTVNALGVTWGEYYRALGICGLFAVVASLAAIPGFGAVDPLVPATGTLAVFALSTGYQLLGRTRGRLRGLLSRLR
ncbi:DUF7344 domain-containing protein [Halorientalis halophila]|uniref:DUF7344 domain-containing protein n=1 Tax=Halorientalis halophila TaxID=3108499 RepID=UPI0030084B34